MVWKPHEEPMVWTPLEVFMVSFEVRKVVDRMESSDSIVSTVSNVQMSRSTPWRKRDTFVRRGWGVGSISVASSFANYAKLLFFIYDLHVSNYERIIRLTLEVVHILELVVWFAFLVFWWYLYLFHLSSISIRIKFLKASLLLSRRWRVSWSIRCVA